MDILGLPLSSLFKAMVRRATRWKYFLGDWITGTIIPRILHDIGGFIMFKL